MTAIMQKDSVISLLNDSSRAAIDMMAAKAVRSREIRKVLVEISLEEIPQVSSRASRVIESSVNMDPKCLLDYEKDILYGLSGIKDSSIRRSFIKIYTLNTLPHDEETQGYLLDACFKYLTHPDEPVAVKVYCMEVLYRFTARYPDIIKELSFTLEEFCEDETGACASRARYLLKQLRLGKLPLEA